MRNLALVGEGVEGVDYSPEAVEAVRKDLIIIRDGALEQGEMHWAVVLSHAIAYLVDYEDAKKAWE